MILSIIEEWLKEENITYTSSLSFIGKGWWLDKYRCWIILDEENADYIVFVTFNSWLGNPSYTRCYYNIHDPNLFKKIKKKIIKNYEY